MIINFLVIVIVAISSILIFFGTRVKKDASLPMLPPEINGQVARMCTKKQTDTAVVLDLLLDQAVLHRATDIHFENISGNYQVRFRVDGLLLDIAVIPSSMSPKIVAYTKNLANLISYRKDIPQEGRFTHMIKGQKSMEIRLSIMPAIGEEAIVMRLFDSLRGNLNVRNLGYSRELKEDYLRLMKKSNGLILVTGPTNSGKTSTLYSSMKFLTNEARRGEKIVSLEDPVEFPLDCISQMQINKEKGLTFDKMLLSLLRQDVEIITIGEIRDQATAEIVLRAALTGHLILSTLHCGNSTEAPKRLMDLGLDASLVGETLIGVIAQRLVRKVCKYCRKEIIVRADDRALMGIPDWIKKTYMGKGCEHCLNTGYYGRMLIAELLKVEGKIEQLIKQQVDSTNIRAQAKELGMVDMITDGFEKVAQGLTSLDELKKVMR